eukprot:1681979-Prymnesium_polylepis.1
MHELLVASAHPWWNPPVEMSAMVTRVATVAALAVHATREKMAGSELSSSAPWKARESSAS